jgi:hypothetical protein
MCFPYTTKAPTGCVRVIHRSEIKNDDTVVPSFLTARISDFNQRASSHIRVPNCIQQDVGTGKQKMTTPKCRHFPFRGEPGISRPNLVTKMSTENL